MDLAGLIEQLADSDPRQQQAAADALVAAGPMVVGPLMAAMEATDSWAYERECVDVVRRIGEPAFWPLVDAITAAQTWSGMERPGSALRALPVSCLPRYVEALRHADHLVRSQVLRAFKDMGARALPYATDVLALVADPDEGVRGAALVALRAMGPNVVHVLRGIRRSPGPLRRAALVALADQWGWNALDGLDQALVRRLIAVKRIREVPEPMTLCGSWYALQTSDQAGVLNAFGLSAPEPVTMRLGQEAWYHTGHHNRNAVGGTHVYVTPVLDGWTLVFGKPSKDAPLDVARDDDNDVVVALSRRFGAAHWYLTSQGETSWSLAENGELVRYYYNDAPHTQIGPPHPAEHDYVREPQEWEYEESAKIAEPLPADLLISDAWATDVAGGASVDPTSLGPHTRVSGHGVLALTAAGRRHPDVPPGALPI